MNQPTDLSSSFINDNTKDKRGSKKLLHKYEIALSYTYDYERNNYNSYNPYKKQETLYWCNYVYFAGRLEMMYVK